MPDESDLALEERFMKAYRQLSEEGVCDGPGGAEGTRVLNEWRRLGRPHNVEEFIRIRANVLPGAKPLFGDESAD